MCAFLGLTEQDLATPAPYARILAFNDKGRQILKEARKTGDFPNIGEVVDSPYQQLENRWGDLYAMFAKAPEPPGQETASRVYCAK